MPKERNKPIATVECAYKGCERTAQVFKYRQQGSPEPWRRRHAGKLYSTCGAGHRCDDQEFILERIKWPNGEKPAVEGSSKPSDESAPVLVPGATELVPASEPTPASTSTPKAAVKQALKAPPWMYGFWKWEK